MPERKEKKHLDGKSFDNSKNWKNFFFLDLKEICFVMNDAIYVHSTSVQLRK